MVLRNSQLRPSSTSRYISLTSIDTKTQGHIVFYFQSFFHPLVDLSLIRIMPNYWATKWTVLITSSKGSQDLEKYHLEVAGVISCYIIIQNIESWLLSFNSFKIWPSMKKKHCWILQPIFQRLIIRSPAEISIASVMILRVKPTGNGVWQTPFFFFWSGLQCPKAYSLWGGVVPSPSIG